MKKRIWWIIGGVFASVLYTACFIQAPKFDPIDSTYVTECTNNADYSQGGGAMYIIDSFNGTIINLVTATGTPITSNFSYKNKISDAMAKDICADHQIPKDHNAFMQQVENDPTTPAVEAGAANYAIVMYKPVFMPSTGIFISDICLIILILAVSIFMFFH